MLVVEFRIDSPLLAETLAQHPAATITDEEGYYDGDTIKYLFWAECPDFTEFDTALAADPTVTNPRTITETTTRRLYRVTLTEKGTRLSTFPAWSEFDLVLLEAHGTHEGWTVRMRLPDRETLTAYQELCREQGFTIELRAVYHDAAEGSPVTARLSPAQQEALAIAYEMGYYDIPRQASLADIAAQIDISSQSVSERLRRGVSTLLETSLLRNTDAL